jgi:hypothetical protein
MFAEFEVKHELNFINFVRCVACFLWLRSDIMNAAGHYPYSLIAEYIKA